MRLSSLEVSGFRAFPAPVVFDLDADVLLVQGPNGTGKTSIFDAILWGLSGTLPRLGSRQDAILSLYSESGTARVQLTIKSPSGDSIRISRVGSGKRSDLSLESGGESWQGSSAEVRLRELLWPPAVSEVGGAGAMATALTRSVYLQQDLVRQFLESDSSEERFKVVGELVGIGRINELLAQMESSRNAWSRARTELERDYDSAQRRLAGMRSLMDRLSSREPPSPHVDHEAWLEKVRLSLRAAPEMDLREDFTIEDALALLRARVRSVASRRTLGRMLQEELPNQPIGIEAEHERVWERVRALEDELALLRRGLVSAEEAAAQERARQAVTRNEGEELRLFAQLALRHLEERCPVCEQSYDLEATRARLQQVANEERPAVEQAVPASVEQAARRVAEAERRLADERRQAAAVEERLRAFMGWRSQLPSKLAEVGLGGATSVSESDLQQLLVRLDDEERLLRSLIDEGEAVGLSLTRASELARRQDLERQLQGEQAAAAQIQARLEAHRRTGDVASRLIDVLRAAAQDAVAAQIEEFGPMVERIYARIDPHPSFRAVQLLAGRARGRGQVRTVVIDPDASFDAQEPAPLFSSSQLNALAVSLFLGLSLGARTLPLDLVLLDDPLQSLDDVNLLGLVDTIRRVKNSRQVVVSTHDTRFAALLRRKLRPVGSAERTIGIEFLQWSREGPTIRFEDVQREPEEIVVAA